MSTQLAWYKQFWPWFLILLPGTVVVASFITMKIALDNADSLVAEDYYKAGKAINMDLGKIKYAKQIGMQFTLNVNDNELIITQQGGPEYQAALNVRFYHPTLEDRDMQLMATSDANGAYRFTMDTNPSGAWEVRLEGFDAKWRIQKRLDLRNNGEYWLN
ncbi:FixH family protein [Shewanella sp. NIFS-20-20]|uniref:FixH family protein n=1 Tax=Shewanella sp. NIFS-20-20 TaxID=2853806 RepID=UPI001C4705C5|nr:FixH family protein [Shewanella sp. NIFS-20-20]MBV7315694.1 FixH family protein [Shewanella sp. NIFS-20-20]